MSRSSPSRRHPRPRPNRRRAPPTPRPASTRATAEMSDTRPHRALSAQTDVGREREHNEDSHAEYDLPDGDVLMIVADGMGGHAAGEVASRIAVEAIGQIFQNSPSDDPR